MAYSFKGGIHPDGHKDATAQKPIELLQAPAFVILPISMHIGAPTEPVVQKGERVLLGQKICDSAAPVSSPVHASVSGTVTEIAPKLHPNGEMVMSVVIENDYQDEPHPSVRPTDTDTLQPDAIVKAIREGGIVGHGGAMFPTHIKISSALGKVDTVLINGAECEPYITSDHRIMLEYPWEVAGGVKILQRLFGISNIKLGIELNKKDVFPILAEYFPLGGPTEVCPMTVKYPQGAEKQLINALTGREVPSGKLPADAGCVVLNIDTVAAIYRLFATGMPMVRRIVTVSGSAVSNPKNLEVRIGTPVENLLDACGGLKAPPTKFMMGGPMMGTPLFSADVPVIKGTNAILAFCEDECVITRHQTCIRCGKCLDACPIKLMPTYIYSSGVKGTVEHLEYYNALDCIECGACAYVCPGKLPLVHGIRTGKQRLMNARRK